MGSGANIDCTTHRLTDRILERKGSDSPQGQRIYDSRTKRQFADHSAEILELLLSVFANRFQGLSPTERTAFSKAVAFCDENLGSPGSISRRIYCDDRWT